jgi:hypothetical protein
MVTVAPRTANSVASSTAEVDLPAPPLELAKAMVGMATLKLLTSADKVDQLINCQLSSNRHQVINSRPTVVFVV